MDPLRIHAYKIHAIKRHKRQQFVSNVLLYSLSTLACTLFCSSPLWYPPFCATFNVIFFFSLPKICSFFFSSKVLFIVGNLIVIFLVGESKFFASKSKASRVSYSDVCYDKYKCKSPKIQVPSRSSKQAMKVKGVSAFESFGEAKTCKSHNEEKIFESYGESKTCKSYNEGELMCWKGEERVVEEEKEDEGVSLPAEELNRLADNFIARINRQRRLEALTFRS